MSYIRLNKHYIHQHFVVLGVVETCLLIGVAWFAEHLQLLLLNAAPVWSINFSDWIPLFIFAVVLSCCTLSMGVYIALVREGYASMMLRTLVSFFLLGSLSLYCVNLALGDEFIDRGLVFWGVLVATLVVFAVRALFIGLVDTANLRRRVIIYGAGKKAEALLTELDTANTKLGVQVVGCIADAGDEIAVNSALLRAVPQNWVAFVKREQISEIVIAPDERRSQSAGEGLPVGEFLDCKVAGVGSTDVLGFCERELNRIDVNMLQPSWLLFSDGFKNSKRHLFIKRAFDLCVSVLFLLVLWPFMLLTALAVKLESAGPALYSQERVGLNGRVFRIYKFRSMRQDAEQAGKAVWAQKNDSRVTRVGNFIRNTRLDELPQLYNVIVGEMSFVGPRPERPQFVAQLAKEIPFYDVRHKVKPGLMGWAQLKYPYGASVEDAKNKLTYDLYYAKNKSFFMDMLILVQTVEIILLGKGVR
ncbi:TIGR03013 family PEP-CTERM/XrtA system glycosyltransferase [Simiduia sp. 21SJ11W-1]|uniref:TIGR03013 family XrtA/PEP-CTERM system glycosyltransferase n=1 Tax=Simiduia sp. 21SJ11W-1 TaxID=2909669 RepID=UPI00209FA5C0|nr:TIGR03013 family XrtA/PEP-CTERM system glycosyltransferase [Simiduia sp. 21SJ11W-1]UTA47379.1 TIGR03013 family PEP-CTERM/XrtA system glycosyltransferase [Simiduia sp. 21SJ11W-1]